MIQQYDMIQRRDWIPHRGDTYDDSLVSSQGNLFRANGHAARESCVQAKRRNYARMLTLAGSWRAWGA